MEATQWSEVQEMGYADNPRYAEDNKLYVQFYSRPVVDVLKSRQANRSIFTDTDFVKIMIAGDRKNVVERVATSDDLARFPEHYAKYKAGIAEQVTGTPLENLPSMTPSRSEEYKHVGIRTIEMLANANDNVASSFIGFQADKKRAKDYIAIAEGQSMQDLVAQMAEMKAQLEAMKKPTRGTA